MLDCKNYELYVLCFKIPPKSVILKSDGLIMLPDDKKSALIGFGAKKVVFLDFNEVKDISENDFLNEIFEKYKPDLISCGFDFRFGKNAIGNTETIKSFCREKGIKAKIAPAVLSNGVPISSTAIRDLISSGNIPLANEQILGGFGFTAPVIHGDERGRTIGFPTINQKYPELLVKPKFGVYSSIIIIEGREYDCITNIGIRPTFKTNECFCESYVLNFKGDVYDKSVTLKPKKFIRNEKKFDSIIELKSAIENDIKNM